MEKQLLKNFSRFLKPIGFVVFILFSFQQSQSQDMEFDWAKQAGGSSEDFGNGIALDDSANVFVTGSFRETAIFGSTTFTSFGSSDIFLQD